MLLIRRQKSKKKYQNGHVTSSHLEKKLVQKSKFSKFFDLKIFENFHWKLYENEKNEIKKNRNFEIENFRKFRLLDQKKIEVRESNMTVLILFLRLLPSDQKHSTRNCLKFAGVKYLVRIVNSRKMAILIAKAMTQNQGIRHERGPISWNHTIPANSEDFFLWFSFGPNSFCVTAI